MTDRIDPKAIADELRVRGRASYTKILITVAVLAALTLIGAPSAAADRQGVWLTGHVQDTGWQLPTNTVAGTTGQSRRLEAIQLVDPVATIRGHVQNLGWQGWTDTGVVGTTG